MATLRRWKGNTAAGFGKFVHVIEYIKKVQKNSVYIFFNSTLRLNIVLCWLLCLFQDKIRLWKWYLNVSYLFGFQWCCIGCSTFSIQSVSLYHRAARLYMRQGFSAHSTFQHFTNVTNWTDRRYQTWSYLGQVTSFPDWFLWFFMLSPVHSF
jgi:hypothetical protein